MTVMALTTLMLLKLHFLLGGMYCNIAEIHFEYVCWRKESHPIKERYPLFCLHGKWTTSIKLGLQENLSNIIFFLRCRSCLKINVILLQTLKYVIF